MFAQADLMRPPASTSRGSMQGAAAWAVKSELAEAGHPKGFSPWRATSSESVMAAVYWSA